MDKFILTTAMVSVTVAAFASVPQLQRGTAYDHDDYETAETARNGKPEIITGLFSPGMLSTTRQGKYQVRQPTRIKGQSVSVPTANDLYLESAFRIYAFGPDTKLVSDFAPAAIVEGKTFRATLTCAGESVRVVLEDFGRSVGSLDIPVSLFPADFSFAISTSGRFVASISSLVDSSVRACDGETVFFKDFPSDVRSIWTLLPAHAGKTAELTVDEYVFAPATAATGAKVPYSIDRLPTFDPQAEGWKLVFEDEFEGDGVDWTNKWFMPYYDARADVRKRTHAQTDGQGHLKLKIDFNDPKEELGDVRLSGNESGSDPKQLGSISLYTAKAYGYGYYEAKLKFTCQNGFWAAFWMYGDSNCNPFLDGFEIDGFEDYYTRRKDKDGNPGRINDHNLHIRTGLGQSKSWNYNSLLSGNFDEWHVMGLKWTPFEISYYMDGKLLKTTRPVGHSPFDTVTFTAFDHCACTAPSHAVLSGCIMKSTWNKAWQDLAGCTFPAYFWVDYVRVWEYPNAPGSSPSVTWSAASSAASALAPTGSVIRLSADVATSVTGSKIKAAYLFDNGYFIGCRTEPPYAFELELSDEALARTAYKRPGRQKQILELNGMPHVFHIYAQDEEGRIGRTDEPLVRFPVFGESRAFRGTPTKLPGKLSPAHFDEGGIPYGYYKHKQSVENLRQDLSPRPSFDFRRDEFASCSADGTALDFLMTCEWYHYTVDIAEAGDYQVTFPYGTPGHGINRLVIYSDGLRLGAADLEPHDGIGFKRDRTTSLTLTLPAGRHRLTLFPIGPLSVGTLMFEKK